MKTIAVAISEVIFSRSADMLDLRRCQTVGMGISILSAKRYVANRL